MNIDQVAQKTMVQPDPEPAVSEQSSAEQDELEQQRTLLDEIDDRQNKLLDDLDRLNSQVSELLQACTGSRTLDSSHFVLGAEAG